MPSNIQRSIVVLTQTVLDLTTLSLYNFLLILSLFSKFACREFLRSSFLATPYFTSLKYVLLLTLLLFSFNYEFFLQCIIYKVLSLLDLQTKDQLIFLIISIGISTSALVLASTSAFTYLKNLISQKNFPKFFEKTYLAEQIHEPLCGRLCFS